MKEKGGVHLVLTEGVRVRVAAAHAREYLAVLPSRHGRGFGGLLRLAPQPRSPNKKKIEKKFIDFILFLCQGMYTCKVFYTR